jgi:hypothetical protein
MSEIVRDLETMELELDGDADIESIQIDGFGLDRNVEQRDDIGIAAEDLEHEFTLEMEPLFKEIWEQQFQAEARVAFALLDFLRQGVPVEDYVRRLAYFHRQT